MKCNESIDENYQEIEKKKVLPPFLDIGQPAPPFLEVGQTFLHF